MFQNLDFHFSTPELIKRAHNRQLDLALIHLTLHIFVCVVFETLKVAFEHLLHFVVCDFSVTIFVPTQKLCHWVLNLILLQIFAFERVCIFLLKIFKFLLLPLFQQVIVFHQL